MATQDFLARAPMASVHTGVPACVAGVEHAGGLPGRTARDTNAIRRKAVLKTSRPGSNVLWVRVCIVMTALSCVRFFAQDELGFGDKFDYTQAIIQAAALGLGFAASLCARHGAKPRHDALSNPDFLIGGFILSALLWSWRSWNPALSVAHALCFAIVVWNLRTCAYVWGARGTFTTLYIATCLIVIAGVGATLVAPQQYSLFMTLATDRSRDRLALFQMHPILIADIMVLNLIVGVFIRTRFRWFGQLLCGTTLLLTASRASIVCGGLILLVAGFYAARQSGKWRNLLLTSAAVLGIGAVTWLLLDSSSFAQAVFPTADSGALIVATSQDQTLNGRIPLWTNVLSAMSLENVMGFGFYGYRKWIFDLSRWAGHAHNSILDAILIGGYPGGALLIIYAAHGLLRRRQWSYTVSPVMCRSLILYTLLVGLMGPTLMEPYMIMYVAVAAHMEVLPACLGRSEHGCRSAIAPISTV